MEDILISVPLSRYEHLVNLEARVAVAVEKISRNDYMELQELLWTLGTDFAVELAFDYKEKEKREQIEESEEEK